MSGLHKNNKNLQPCHDQRIPYVRVIYELLVFQKTVKSLLLVKCFAKKGHGERCQVLRAEKYTASTDKQCSHLSGNCLGAIFLIDTKLFVEKEHSNLCEKVLLNIGISWSPDLRVQHMYCANFKYLKQV